MRTVPMCPVPMCHAIDFLLENAGPVIRYRLRKEILRDLTAIEAENLLEQIYRTPHFKLVERYVKPDGYIGSGAHSWNIWRGAILHETPSRTAKPRPGCCPAMPLRKPTALSQTSSPPCGTKTFFEVSFRTFPPKSNVWGINSGFCLMTLMYAMQAMLGCGDDEYVLPLKGRPMC